VRKAVGGENGRAVDAATPDKRRTSARDMGQVGPTHHENIACGSYSAHVESHGGQKALMREGRTLCVM
jgi:hypothetical protein